MADTVRLSTWGWFSRAFAAGFGAMFGVFTASLMICLFSYALFAVVAITFSSVTGNGSVTLTPSMVSLAPSPPTTCTPPLLPVPSTGNAPSYTNNSFNSPANPYAGTGNPYAGTSYGANPTSRYAATPASAVASEAEADPFEAPQTLADDVQYFAAGPVFDDTTDDGDETALPEAPLEETSVEEDVESEAAKLR